MVDLLSENVGQDPQVDSDVILQVRALVSLHPQELTHDRFFPVYQLALRDITIERISFVKRNGQLELDPRLLRFTKSSNSQRRTSRTSGGACSSSSSSR